MDRFWQIAGEQGWDDASLVTVLTRFISEQQDGDALAAFAQRVADDENQ